MRSVMRQSLYDSRHNY